MIFRFKCQSEFHIMFVVILLLVVTSGVSRVFSSYSYDHEFKQKGNIQTVGAGLKFHKNITFASEKFQVISYVAKFLNLMRINKISISVKQGKSVDEFTRIKPMVTNRKLLFETSLPLVKLGDDEDYYYFETSLTVNYFQAFEFCRKNHMDLLSIESRKEDYLFNKFPRVSSVWTSGTDIGLEGHYIWLSTGQPFTFTNWHPFYIVEPNNFNNSEHCIHMYQYFNTPNYFYWNDISCKVNYNFVCETKPIPIKS